MNDGWLGWLRLVFVAIENIGFASMAGVLLSRRWLPPAHSPGQALLDARAVVMLRLASGITLAASLLAFWVHCALMSEVEVDDAWPAVRSMIAATGFGKAWLAAALALAVAFVHALVRPPRLRQAAPLFWLALCIVALARSHMGHAVDAGAFSLPVWANAVHLLSISIWTGIVFVAAALVAPSWTRAPLDAHEANAAFVRSLSDTATWALIVLAATGAYNGWRVIGTGTGLYASAYGQMLLLKLLLVLIAAALGGYNRWFGMPPLLGAWAERSAHASVQACARFVHALRIEAVVLTVALVIATLLASSPLPGAG